MGRQNMDTGRSGEFLAAYILETHDVEVHHVDRAGADLWCKVRGSIVTVQVKSASAPGFSSKKTSVPYYVFHTKGRNADWYCFVALDRQLLLMRRTDQLSAETLRIAPSEFNEANQRRTIEEMFNSC
jgi:hypothetical protein